MSNIFSVTHLNDLLTLTWMLAMLTFSYKSRVKPWLCAVLFVACLVGGLGSIFLQESVFPNFAVYMLLFILWGCIYGAVALKGSFLWKMAMAAVYGCVTFHLGKVAALVNSWLPKSSSIEWVSGPQPAQPATGFILFQLFALAAAIFLVRRAVTTERKVPAVCWSSLMIVSLIGVGFAYYQMVHDPGPDALAPSALYSMGMVLIVLLVQQLCSVVIVNNERNLIRLSLDQSGKREALMARQASRTEEELRRYRHETANHLLAVSALLENGETEKAHQLVREIVSAPISASSDSSGNPLVDAIIGQKRAQCKELGIAFETDLIVSEKLPLTDAEISSLLGNLFNNAIEAARQCEDPFVRSRIYPSREYLCVEVVNRADPAKLKGNPSLMTTKGNPELHGIGLKVVKEIADRHQGMTFFETSPEGQFTARVMIHL
ncbi:MAG: GHKL domain-containing protein [Clostridia bacterium]|nr:GHKL domain-containing protein [Clostridia bacterium]